jgi:Zn-dependent peptidase ImmA (M78 family)
MYTEVEFLSESVIEANAQDLLNDFAHDQRPLDRPPVPVEDLAEKQLGLSLDFTDLNARFGGRDVLGALWAQQRAVYIDERLDPDEFPAQEGRCRFTVAHELGHYCQHRPYFYIDPNQGSLFGNDETPSVVCREIDEHTRIEFQANCFAAALLMPRRMVCDAWNVAYGSLEPLNWWETDETDIDQVASDFARQFRVSRQAMRIRLTGLGLFRRDADLGPRSFWAGGD